MTPDTMAVLQELEQRVSELDTALERVTESRDEIRLELAATNATLRNAMATIDRLRIANRAGVEL